jgi:Fe-S cluster assembly protein SufB
MDTAVQEHEELVKEYFMSQCVPPEDNKFAALHGAVWSGGSFVYVPEGVEVEIPVQAYFRMNSKGMGQFEHTLIIAEENSTIHYIEGCHPAGTMVETSEGEKPIEDIREDDSVLTHSGRFRNVEGTQERSHKGHIYDIEFWGDSTRNLTLTPGHPVLICRRERDRESNKDWSTQWVEAKDVEKKDYMVVPRRDFGGKQQVDFAVKEWDNSAREFNMVNKSVPAEPGFFRLIGYYLAEGSNSGGHYLNFSFNSDEEEYLEDVEELLEEYFDHSPDRYPHKTNNGTTIRLNSTEAVRVFEEFGERAGDKEIPEWIHDYGEENVAEMLKGFFRGDGNWYSQECKHGDKSLYRFNTVSEQLAKKTRKLLLDLGIGAFINRREREQPRQDIYTVGIAGQHMEKFCQEILEQEFMEDSKTRQSKIHFENGKVFVPVRDVRKRETDQKVYNLKVAEDESYVSEGVAVHNCSAPQYTRNNLHAGCVEVFVKEDAHVQYSTVQNWSKNTYNLNTKRSLVDRNGTMEWISGSMGSKVTMLYPSSHLQGRGAKDNHVTIAFAGDGQDIDTGAKVIHDAPDTKSTIESKSISQEGGRTNYRGLVRVTDRADGAQVSVECLPGQSPVYTGSGIRKIEEIQPDDEVLTHTGETRKVRATSERRYDGEVVEIRPAGTSESVKLTPEHPVRVVEREKYPRKNSGFSPEWIPASDVEEADYISMPRPNMPDESPDEFFEAEHHYQNQIQKYSYTEKAAQVHRLAGYYIAEGCTSGSTSASTKTRKR